MSALFLTAPSAIRGSALFARDRTIRREIRRWWVGKPVRWAAWLMLNPSNAGEDRNDPTARRVTQFTMRWGFDGWIGINLYPVISSHPKQMWHWADYESNGPDWYARDDMEANLEDIGRVAREASLRMVAFGAAPIERDEMRLEQALEQFEQPSDIGADERFYCLGITQSGQPLHPLARGKHRIPDSATAQLWRRT